MGHWPYLPGTPHYSPTVREWAGLVALISKMWKSGAQRGKASPECIGVMAGLKHSSADSKASILPFRAAYYHL